VQRKAADPVISLGHICGMPLCRGDSDFGE
jgi:hypothetical protein